MRSVRAVAGWLLALGCVFLCSSCGPRMRDQISIQPYERQMPGMPAGSVPTRGRIQTLTALQVNQPNPLQPTQANIKRGELYYGHYCRMCHGPKGDGDGPVGESYVPKPTDLTSEAVTGLTDGQVYARMLTGTGHSPVMVGTVPPGQRWPIVLYVRSLADRQGGTSR